MPPPLTVYMVRAEADQDVVVRTAKVPLREAGVHSYVGLRERLVGAVQRYNASFPGRVTAVTHVLLEVAFTTEGIARYCTAITNAAQRFARVRTQKTYADPPRGWGVWHCIGDLPLDEPNNIVPVWRDITDGGVA